MFVQVVIKLVADLNFFMGIKWANMGSLVDSLVDSCINLRIKMPKVKEIRLIGRLFFTLKVTASNHASM